MLIRTENNHHRKDKVAANMEDVSHTMGNQVNWESRQTFEQSDNQYIYIYIYIYRKAHKGTQSKRYTFNWEQLYMRRNKGKV